MLRLMLTITLHINLYTLVTQKQMEKDNKYWKGEQNLINIKLCPLVAEDNLVA